MTTISPRSALFVPMSSEKMIAGAFQAGADMVIFDLEDGVGPAHKRAARANLGYALGWPRGRSAAFVRINSPLTEDGLADLMLMSDHSPDGLVVAKAEPRSIAIAAESGLPLIALVETARGLLDAAEIAAHDDVCALLMGQVDLGAELGVEESHDGTELLFARGHLVVAAAAAGKPGPIDGPCIYPRDSEALGLQIERARRLGFAGKACIHPAQVGPVTRAFSASEEEVAWARRVTDAFEVAGEGVTVLDGQMIDRPVALRAQQILERDERRVQ